jgi:hypothetical protein
MGWRLLLCCCQLAAKRCKPLAGLCWLCFQLRLCLDGGVLRWRCAVILLVTDSTGGQEQLQRRHRALAVPQTVCRELTVVA